MAESTFSTASTVTIDGVVIDASSPLDGEILAFDGTKFVSDYAVPVGTIEMWGGRTTAPPYGWLICNGAEYAIGSSGSTYYALSQVIGTRYGALTNGSGVAGSSHFRVPNMQSFIPLGIAIASTPTGTPNTGTNITFSNDGLTSHSHNFNSTTATTAADGGTHSHQYEVGGAHNHTMQTSNWSHTHNSNTVSNTHLHNINNNGSISGAQTGFTSHSASQHGNLGGDAGNHTHTSNTQSIGHGHNIANSNNTSHNHSWNSSATSGNANATGSHTHTFAVQSVSFIIKY